MYDAAVVGLGAMGAATLATLARRGARAIGLEQFARGHQLGASSGRSRMIRKAYFEDPAYVPLVLRAYDAWRELEDRTGRTFLHITGVLLIGSEQSEVLRGARRSAQEHRLAFDELHARDVARRFPMFRLDPGEVALYEPDGGFLEPELAVQSMLDVAESNGAEMRFNAPVRAWAALAGGGIRVSFEDGSTLDTARLALCAGPWIASLDDAEFRVPVVVERNVQHWFDARDPEFALGRCPSFLADRPGAPGPIYGFPNHGAGLKAAFHGAGALTTPETLDREVHESDVEPVRRALEGLLPGAAGPYLGGKVCMYALTPDRHFLIDAHPGHPGVAVAGGFSGHGFKFAPVVGEVVADLLMDGHSTYDTALFTAGRFLAGAPFETPEKA
jgi:sarcosine oxidase